MSSDTLTITDNRTGKTYELPITDETIKATDLRQIKTDPTDFGLMPYDPSYMNTASCKSRITFIDGDRGILEYRGYPIDQLAEKASFFETAYLIWYGELPNTAQLADWTAKVSGQPGVPDGLKRIVAAFDRNAHPMGMLVSMLGAMSAAYPEAKKIGDAPTRLSQAMRLLWQVPAVSACIHRHRQGLPFIDPDPKLSYAGNFLRMLFAKDNGPYAPDPVLEEAVDILLILHAEHEQNCSTSTMRLVGSAHADPYASMAAAAAALYGPLHGGANEAVLKMLKEIGSTDHIPAFIAKVKAGEAASWVSAIASTRTTIRAPSSSRPRQTKCLRSPARARCLKWRWRWKKLRSKTSISSSANSIRT